MPIPSTVTMTPSPTMVGSVIPPGDKSISHRALLLSALGEGRSTINGLSPGADVQATKTIIEQLGAFTADAKNGFLEVTGGRSRLHASIEPLDCGNSGTTMRLLMGLLSGIEGTHRLVGDASLTLRPMDRVAQPLREMGATITGRSDREFPPIEIIGTTLQGIEFTTKMASAQVKSAILLAGLCASGTTVLHELIETRPHTEEMMAAAGASISEERSKGGKSITLYPSTLQARHWEVPGDPSNAAFWVVGGLLAERGEVHIRHIYSGSTRVGFLSVLERMGGAIERVSSDDFSVDLIIKSAALGGTTIESREIPSLDEIPILAVAAAGSEGVTRFLDAEELRVKESDRFALTMALAKSLGATSWAEGNTLCIKGIGSPRNFLSFDFDCHHDHRLAMAAAIAGRVGNGGVIHGFTSISTNYPSFLDHMDQLQ